MKGFNRKEKVEIAKNFTTPKVAQNIGLDIVYYLIYDDVYQYIVDNYCAEEKGIRKLEKCIETLLMKVNLYRLTKDPKYIENIESKGHTTVVTKPMASKILNKFFNMSDGANMMIQMMYN